MKLDEGDIVDCPDDNVWYNSTIVQRIPPSSESEGEPVIELKVGFRYYDPNGLLLDAKTG